MIRCSPNQIEVGREFLALINVQTMSLLNQLFFSIISLLTFNYSLIIMVITSISSSVTAVIVEFYKVMDFYKKLFIFEESKKERKPCLYVERRLFSLFIQ